MNNLIKERLFRLLSDASQTDAHEIESAYENFIEKIKNASNHKDNMSFYRILHFSRIEFASFEAVYQYGQGEKCT